jgi:hypothetical protein
MSGQGKDALWSFLFASEDCQLVNLKLMRGDRQDISTQELREQVHSALMQVKTGTSEMSENFPETSLGLQVDLHKLAASF